MSSLQSMRLFWWGWEREKSDLVTTQTYCKTEESNLYNCSLLAWQDDVDVLGIGCQRAVLLREKTWVLRERLFASNTFCFMCIRFTSVNS